MIMAVPAAAIANSLKLCQHMRPEYRLVQTLPGACDGEAWLCFAPTEQDKQASFTTPHKEEQDRTKCRKRA